MRQGTGCGEICHIPVTSLVKYPPPSPTSCFKVLFRYHTDEGLSPRREALYALSYAPRESKKIYAFGGLCNKKCKVAI